MARTRSSVPKTHGALPVQPTWRTSAPLFLWLGVTAVLYYVAGKVILLIAAIIGLVIAWVAFAGRFPLTAIFIVGFLRGLLGGRR